MIIEIGSNYNKKDKTNESDIVIVYLIGNGYIMKISSDEKTVRVLTVSMEMTDEEAKSLQPFLHWAVTNLLDCDDQTVKDGFNVYFKLVRELARHI